MMLPLSFFSITGSTCFIPRNTPTTLTSSTPAKRFKRIFSDRLDVVLDAGVVVEHVDGAEPVEAGLDIAGDLVLLRDIGCDGECLRRGRQILDRGVQVLALAVDCDNSRAAFGQ
jgi:hypothetical protein